MVNFHEFPLLRLSSPNKNTIKHPLADSPRNHNHSKTVAIGHGLSESRNGTAMDSSVLQLKQLLYMGPICDRWLDRWLWYTLIMCHLSSVIIISVSSVSSSNIFTKYSKVARVQEKPEQIRTENNPLCLRNGSSMILQSFLLGSFEQYTVAERWLWVALQSTISLVNRMANMVRSVRVSWVNSQRRSSDNHCRWLQASRSIPVGWTRRTRPAYYLAMLRTAAAPRQ